MKIAVLGSSIVGQQISKKLNEIGYEVYMGTRDPEETKARTEPHFMTQVSFADWYKENPNIKLCKFSELPEDVNLIINATNGDFSIEALTIAGREYLKGKVILDLANGLDFSKGMPPSLSVCNTDSIGERIQAFLPESHVVKTLNTVNFQVMTNPTMVNGDPAVFLSGNNEEAKSTVSELLEKFGWKADNIIDLGDISTARGQEMMLPMFFRVWDALGTPFFNFGIVRNNH